jgi:DNA polymerase-3 subunit delta
VFPLQAGPFAAAELLNDPCVLLVRSGSQLARARRPISINQLDKLPLPPDLDSQGMPAFKPAYLVCGDDHGRIAERRAGLRELAEAESGAGGLELFDGERSTPDEVAAALSAMTLVLSRRFLIVDGAERWKDKDLDELEAAMTAIAPDTTIAFFAREESRFKAPERLHRAVKAAKGVSSVENAVKSWELPKWVAAQAREHGLELEPGAAKALVTHVGDRQQRLLRELEKLALGGAADESADGPVKPSADGPVKLSVDDIDRLTASSAQRGAWTVADAIIAGDAQAAIRTFLALRQQGERVAGLLYQISMRVRTAQEVAAALERGEPQAQLKRTLRMPSRAADRLIEDARRSGAERLRELTGEIADLELASRGGGPGGIGEDTAALSLIAGLDRRSA